jgi:beta-glucosidase
MVNHLTRRQVIKAAAAVGSGLFVGGGLPRGARAGDPGGRVPQYQFPGDFLWGAGTSGLQHEGSPLADGAGPSAMYQWAQAGKKKAATSSWLPAPIDTFDVTADFYRRFPSDIGLMREMNLQAYNFEVYWPRIFPEGTGRVNSAGLDFYDRLVDAFLEGGIVPLCNLYVHDHPAALQERGGWLNRDMAQWYADYAAVLYERLGDRVPYWTTICEIFIVDIFLAGAAGPVPDDKSAGLRARHHLLLGQGLAVQAFRASGAKGQIGNQHAVVPMAPASDSEEDIAAAERMDAYWNRLLLDSQMRGEYPEDLMEWFGANWPADAIRNGDLATISAPIDFFGMDYYFNMTVQHDPAAEGRGSELQTHVEREASADGMREALVWVRERYGDIPILLLEIGHTVEDTVENGKVHDDARIAYFRDLLTGAHRAISEGVDLRACFIWSFLDGWEFSRGLSSRYGLVYVDYETQRRIIKDSGHWYRGVIRANGVTPADVNSAARSGAG